jgi:hypothetical protein
MGELPEAYLQPGTLLGQCRIEALLDAGGMGEVYLAEHLVMQKKVAVKVLPARLAVDPGALQRFLNEVRSLARMNPHPNVVAAFHAGEYAGGHYLVMEYVPGINLKDHVARAGPLPVEQACDMILQAARGLEYVHRHQLVHRDFKPSNLMLTPDGTVKVLDLGLARHAPPGGRDADASLTPAGAVLGTPDYVSPEQARLAREADACSDLYSLGCTFYHLLAGRPPFRHVETTRKVLAHARESPPPVRELRPDVPEAVAALVHKLLAKRPEERYPSTRAFIEALEAATGAGPQRPGRKSWWLVAAAVGLLLAGLGTYLAMTRLGGGDSSLSRGVRTGEKLGLQLILSAVKKGNNERLLSLEDPGVLPLQAGDALRIEARTAWPAYFYVLNMDAGGEVWPMYPWRNNDWGDVAEEKPRDLFCIPDPSKGDAANLKPGASGIESVLVLARETPLTAGERQQLRDMLGAWPKDQGKFDPLRSAVSIGADEVHFGDAHDREVRGAISQDDAVVLKDPVLRLRHLLQGGVRALGVASRGVCYTFRGD